MFRGHFSSEIVPVKDFEVQNPILESKMAKSVAQRPKMKEPFRNDNIVFLCNSLSLLFFFQFVFSFSCSVCFVFHFIIVFLEPPTRILMPKSIFGTF